MSSENKKRKQVSSYCDGSSLKWKNRCKRIAFYNSAQRQQNKRAAIMAFEEMPAELFYLPKF